MNESFDKTANLIHGILSMVTEIIVRVSQRYDIRLTGVKAYPKLEENKRVVELHWSTENITLRVNIHSSAQNILSITVFMPDNANKELQKKLWEVSDILKKVNVSFGGSAVPQIDREEI